MVATDPSARRRSADLFGNEKMAEVVLALDAVFPATVQVVATETRMAHNLAGAVVKRLAAAGVITQLPRATQRGPAYYDVEDREVWERLVELCRAMDRRPTTFGFDGQPDISKRSSMP